MSTSPGAIVAEEAGFEPPAPIAPEPAPEPAGQSPAPLGRRAATGFLLMSGQSLFTRVASFLAQMVLSRWLLASDFGLFAIAMNVQGYASMAQQIGVREVLISRQKKFHLWQNSTFWIAQTMGVLSGVAVAAAAPIVAWCYHDPATAWWLSPLLPMLLIFAFSQPLYNLTLVQESKVQIDLRFKYAAAGTAAQGLAQAVSQIAFALLHFGAFALAWPRFVVGVVKSLIYVKSTPIKVRRDPQFRVWKYVLVPGSMVLLTNLAYQLPQSVPVFALGRVGGANSQIGKELAGFFYLAYSLSIQTVLMLSLQLDGVLFPTLGKMQGDPVRQRAALLRAGHALTAIMAPLCAFQIVAARPLILLFFSPKDNPLKWEAAVLPFQIMSVGMLLCGAYTPAHSLLQAQGRFAAKLAIATFWGILSSIVSIVGILLAPPEYKTAAAAVGMCVSIGGYSTHYCVAATRPLGGSAMDAVRIVIMPTLVAAMAGAAAWFARGLLPAAVGGPRMTFAVQIAFLGTVGGIVYVAGLRVLAPGVWADLINAAQPIFRRLGLGKKTV